MKKSKFILLLAGFLLLSSISFAQDEAVEMADLMRSNGRIYVVVAVVVLILLGLFFYLVRLERKIKRLEKENS